MMDRETLVLETTIKAASKVISGITQLRAQVMREIESQPLHQKLEDEPIVQRLDIRILTAQHEIIDLVLDMTTAIGQKQKENLR